MWCQNCRQDVPGLASPEGRGPCCARCSQPLRSASDSEAPAATVAAPPEASTTSTLRIDRPSVPRFDPWEANERLRHAERVLQSIPRLPRNDTARGERIRIDVPRYAEYEPTKPARAARDTTERGTVASGVAWTLLGLGMAAFACGAALAIWGWSAGRAELTGLGMPIALGGQIALAIGFVLELTLTRRVKAQSPSPLAELDDHLEELRRQINHRQR